MIVIKQIIEKHGGIAHLRNNPIKIEVEGYMPLSIEWIGQGFRRSDLISVMHWFMQNGDLMRDPDMVFATTGDDWTAISYRQDSLGIYQEAIWQDEAGEIKMNLRLMNELADFAEQWSENLQEQGFND